VVTVQKSNCLMFHWHIGISFLMSLNNPLFKNIPHIGSFWHFVICFICVFCICIFVFVCSAHGNMIFDILEQSSIQKYTTCWVFLALRHMLYLCILYLYFCICAFDTWEYNFWNPWTILFSKIYHMLGLSGTSSYAVFVYLCILYLYFLYLRVWHMGILFLISLNNPLFKNIPHAGSF